MTWASRRDLLGIAIAALTVGPAAHALAGADDPKTAPLAPNRELRVPVRGGNIYVRINGNLKASAKPLLMVHGGPGGGLWHFLPVLPLASERAIILYDQLDNGRSDSPGDPANWSVERFVSEIDAVRAALDLRDFHLLGHSWGATLANVYAARRPGGLRSLILQSPNLSAKSWERSTKSWLPSLPDGLGKVMDAHERAGTLDDPAYKKAFDAFLRAHILRSQFPPWLREYLKTIPKNHGDDLYQAMVGGTEIYTSGILAGFDDEALLRQITAPTLMMCGEFDEMTPSETQRLSRKLRNGRMVVLPNSGHMAEYDAPDAWRREISKFVTAYD